MSFMGSLTPIKLGVRFEPPAIILIYREKGKLRRRVIPTPNIDILTDVTLYSQAFKTNPKYKRFFDRVQTTKIEKIVFILQDNMKGYNLQESVDRAKKFDSPSKPDDSEISESYDIMMKKKGIDDYDDDDFHDTEDENDDYGQNKATKNGKKLNEISVGDSTEIEDLIGTLQLSNPTSNKTKNEPEASKIDSLNLLSNQMKNVKSSIYDFEDDVESDGEDVSSILNKFTKKPEQEEDKFETEEHVLTDESF